jgi:hypothetical protein
VKVEEKICQKCHTHFSPEEHSQGLVIDDQIFLCEDCSQHSLDDHEIEEVASSKQLLGNEMPIALWLIKEQNKGKTFMSAKR